MSRTQADGNEAEDLALQFLQRQGLKLLGRNQHSRVGELDLVMRDGDSVVVVEVRKRAHRTFGGAAGSVDRRKRDKIVLATRHWLSTRDDLARCPVRFDVITFDAEQRIDWIKAAFDADHWT